MAAKETGFTICATLLLWDICSLALRRRGSQTRWARHFIRAAATLSLAAAYLELRRRVIGGDTLVHIYRKVENPLPFYATRTQRILSTVQQHALYVGLLVAPLHLSADWSFACVQPVHTLLDSRNIAPIAIAALLGAALLAAQPWKLDSCEPLRAARLRLFVVLAFGVAPFLPAANIFLYVGTYIGERLLYMPSLGFCLLLAEPLARASGPVHMLEKGEKPLPAASSSQRRAAAWLITILLLLSYGVRTAVRNRDWESEETLFLAAMRVCPNSAKVRLNVGILARRSQDWEGALAHFRHARKMEPGYCDPQYWIGLTMVTSTAVPSAPCRTHAGSRVGEPRQRAEGSVRPGSCVGLQMGRCGGWASASQGARHAVSLARCLCRHFTQITTELLTRDANDVRALSTRGTLLTKMEQHEEACRAFVRAASALAASGQNADAATMRRRCQVSHGEAAAVGYDLASCEQAILEMQASLASHKEAAASSAADALRGSRAALARAFLLQVGGSCDSHEGYLAAVNALQRAEPYDPLLHREWARLLSLRPGREVEAKQHMNAAAALFADAGLQAAAAEVASLLSNMLPARTHARDEL
jgi:hypothetical protein